MSTGNPLVSILIPAYNAADFLRASVESILAQTYPHLEIIVVNDGSTDTTRAVADSFSDKRIKVIHKDNGGVASALNCALENATGNYLARQDADDISLPGRIAAEVDFLEQHPAFGLVGAQADVIDANGMIKGKLRHPTGNTELKYALLWDSPFVSSTCLFRKECLAVTGDFYTGKDLFEDYNMWSAIALHYKIANLPEVFLHYRELSSGLSFTTANTEERVINQRKRNLAACFPAMKKEFVEALAWSGKKRTPVSSLGDVKKIFETITEYFRTQGATPAEMTAIRKDLAARMHAFRWMTGEHKGILYYPGRMLEKLFYPKN